MSNRQDLHLEGRDDGGGDDDEVDTASCAACPHGLELLTFGGDTKETACAAGRRVTQWVVARGYWRAGATSVRVRECLFEGSCRGGGLAGDELCSEKARGPLCAVCADDHYQRTDHSCERCTAAHVGTAWGVAASVVGWLGALAVATRLLQRRLRHFRKHSDRLAAKVKQGRRRCGCTPGYSAPFPSRPDDDSSSFCDSVMAHGASGFVFRKFGNGTSRGDIGPLDDEKLLPLRLLDHRRVAQLATKLKLIVITSQIIGQFVVHFAVAWPAVCVRARHRPSSPPRLPESRHVLRRTDAAPRPPGEAGGGATERAAPRARSVVRTVGVLRAGGVAAGTRSLPSASLCSTSTWRASFRSAASSRTTSTRRCSS